MMRPATHWRLRSIPRDWIHDRQTYPWRGGSPCCASPSRRPHRGHRGSPRSCSSKAISPPAVGPRTAPRPLARLKALCPRLGRGAIPGRADRERLAPVEVLVLLRVAASEATVAELAAALDREVITIRRTAGDDAGSKRVGVTWSLHIPRSVPTLGLRGRA